MFVVKVMALLVLVTRICSDQVRFGVASVGEEKFCVGYRTHAWTRHSFSLPHDGMVYRVHPCNVMLSNNMTGYTLGSNNTAGYSIGSNNTAGYTLGSGSSGELPATLIDRSCDVNQIKGDDSGILFVKAPFSEELTSKLSSSNLESVMQVRGDILSAIKVNGTVLVEPIQFGRIYWGSVIMYFFALIYVPLCAVVAEAGRQVIERHAATSPLQKLPSFTQTRAALIIFLIFFFSVVTLAFGGYVLRPVMFQPFFAAFLSTLAVVGFYHLVFPLIVYLAINYIRVVNKTYWVVERTSVIVGGVVIFSFWFYYRTELNIWPLQLFMMACVGVVPNRYAPVNCIMKCIVFLFIGVFFSLLQRYILPAISPTTPPSFVDIVTLQARIPDTISPGPLFLPDEIEPNMLSFRVPLFGSNSPCSPVLDGTFGMSNLFIPSLLIKAAMLTDAQIPTRENFLLRNYTTAVLCFLVCHIAVFVWSFLAQTPVNSNIVYLPGITLGIILNSLRMGSMKEALYPPPPEVTPPEGSEPPLEITVYKATAEDQI